MFSREKIVAAIDVCEVLEAYHPTDEGKWNLHRAKISLLKDLHERDAEREKNEAGRI